MKIITEHIYTPTTVRCFDWAATLDDYEPGDPVGRGTTEQEAIDNLKELLGDQ